MKINQKLIKALDAECIEWDIDGNAVHTNIGQVIYDMSDPFNSFDERYELEDGTVYKDAARLVNDLLIQVGDIEI